MISPLSLHNSRCVISRATRQAWQGVRHLATRSSSDLPGAERPYPCATAVAPAGTDQDVIEVT